MELAPPSPIAAAAIREIRALAAEMLAVPSRLADPADRIAVTAALASIVSAAAPVDGQPPLTAQVAAVRGDVWREAYADGAGASQAQIARLAGVSQVSVHRVVALGGTAADAGDPV
jgi:hypothetical protein